MLTQEPFLDSTQIVESQGSLSQLHVEVTSMYLISNSLMPWSLFILFVSPPSAQYSPYQEKVWPEEAILCHCNQSCDNEEDGKRSD